MNRLQRVVVTGAFGGLAAATVAASGAFACSPTAAVKVLDANDVLLSPAVVRPGEQVNLSLNNFLDPTKTEEAGAGLVSVYWVDAAGNKSLLDSHAGPAFRMSMTVPASLKSSPDKYYVIGEQLRPDGTKKTELQTVWIGESRAVPTVVPPAATPAEVEARTVRAPAAPRAQERTAAPVAAPSAPAAAAAPAAAGVVQTAPAPAAAVQQPATAPAVPVVNGPAVRTDEALPSADLWSGLNPDSTPSLLDGAAPAQRSSTSPVGAVLLGGGLIALAGVALAATRRRLAVSHITRR